MNPSGSHEVAQGHRCEPAESEAALRASEDEGRVLPENPPPAHTDVADDRQRRVITRKLSPDTSFDRSINPRCGPRAALTSQRLYRARHGLWFEDTLSPLDCGRFRVPDRPGTQQSLF